ncbi:MAG: hypothetical protein RLY20_663 [Verrucomicrobiota bacterium]|jgi:hypothetical protein
MLTMLSMLPPISASVTLTKPVIAGIGFAALVVIFLVFKFSKFMVKLLLLLVALAALGLAAWWYFGAHHG